MLLELLRYSSSTATLGLLFSLIQEGACLERHFLCYTLEDAFHPTKIPGMTRIPKGVYDVDFHFGAHFSSYRSRYPRVHPTNNHGMLCLQNVPGFENILIHIGNDVSDTEGCLLVGTLPFITTSGEQMISGSTAAYTIIYPLIANALLSSDKVRISIMDYDTPATTE